MQAYKLRAAEIADLAHNPQGAVGGDAGAFLRGLDEEERMRLNPPPSPPLVSRHWLELRLVGLTAGGDAVGASVPDCAREFQSYEGLHGRAPCEEEVIEVA